MRSPLFPPLSLVLPVSPLHSPSLFRVASHRVLSFPFVPIRFVSFCVQRKTRNRTRTASNPRPSYRRRRMLPNDGTSSPSVLLISRKRGEVAPSMVPVGERTKVFVVPIGFQEAVGTIPSQVSQIIHHFEAERQEAR